MYKRQVQGNGAGFDGDAALPLDVHVIEDLILHDALVHALGQLQNAVRQGGLAVVDVGYDAEVADVFHKSHKNVCKYTKYFGF